MSLLSATHAGSPFRTNGRLASFGAGGRSLYRNLRLVAECLAMIGLSCGIMACGGMFGFLSNQKVFDAQSQRFAEDSFKAGDSSSSGKARATWETFDQAGYLSGQPQALRRLKSAIAVRGCFGRSRFELFNPTGFVFASYVCEIDAKGGPLLLNMGLRRDPDAWKIIALYVDDAPEG